ETRRRCDCCGRLVEAPLSLTRGAIHLPGVLASGSETAEGLPPLGRVVCAVEDPQTNSAEMPALDPLESDVPGFEIVVPALDEGVALSVDVPGRALERVPTAAVLSGRGFAVREGAASSRTEDR